MATLRRRRNLADDIDALRVYDVIRGDDNVVHGEEDRIEPELVPFSSIPKLSPGLMNRLGQIGVEQLFRHQADAINAAMAGNNVVLESPTASGKTLSFAKPVIESLIQSRRGHALFVYPMKAVAFDQRSKLQELHQGLTDRAGADIESWTYDGDVGYEERSALRESPPSILLTNIEYINSSFLAFNDIWEKFLDNLKWIVLDEVHEYRGYFGTNAAMVLRRLLHFMKSRNCEPNVFMATATCENPREHAKNLTGLDVDVISARDSLRPKRDYLFVDPKIPDHRFWGILQLRASLAARALDDLGMSAILFCPTRRFVEDAFQKTRRLYDDEGVDADHIRLFKSGMPEEDRHEILSGLKSGEVRLVFSTNALELGIDLPGLDAVVMVGFPDNVMSARQQIGRAGRSWDSDGLVVYLARNNHVDRFYANNLEAFLTKPLDEIVVDTANDEIAKDHARCVWFEADPREMPVGGSLLGTGMIDRIKAMVDRGEFPPGLRSPRRQTPQRSIQIRGASSGTFHLQCDGVELGTISSYQKSRRHMTAP